MASQVPWFPWKQVYDLHSVTFRVFSWVSSCWLYQTKWVFIEGSRITDWKKASLDWEWWSGNVSAWMDGKRLSPSYNHWPIGSHLSRVAQVCDQGRIDGWMMALWSSMCFVKTLFPKLYRYAAVFDHTMQIVHVIYCTCPLLHPRIGFSSAGAELQGKYNFQNAQIVKSMWLLWNLRNVHICCGYTVMMTWQMRPFSGGAG